MELQVYETVYNIEGVVNSRLRTFLTPFYPGIHVSRDLKTDEQPNLQVWCRIIGPAVEKSDGFQMQVFQISVVGKDGNTMNARSIVSDVAALVRAYMSTSDFLTEPIINSETTSGGYATSELDGFVSPAETFTVSVYQTASNKTV